MRGARCGRRGNGGSERDGGVVAGSCGLVVRVKGERGVGGGSLVVRYCPIGRWCAIGLRQPCTVSKVANRSIRHESLVGEDLVANPKQARRHVRRYVCGLGAL